jgi:hypothetical protein
MLLPLLAFAAPAHASAQGRCGAALLDGLPDRLRAIAAQRPAGPDDAVRRARDIAAVVNDPAMTAALSQPCPGDGNDAVLRTVARQRVLTLWAKMLALDAVDEPVYPAPYDRRCAGVDGATWQLAFIRAYVERLDAQGFDTTRAALRQAIDEDPLAQSVHDAVADRARRLRIAALPVSDSDEAAWLQANELLRQQALAAAGAGARCGPIAGIGL